MGERYETPPRLRAQLSPVLHDVKFFLRWLRRPSGIGAVIPSSRRLAAAMAREIDMRAPGLVVELGGGTGNITAGLLAAGVDPRDLIVVEQEAAFCKILRQRFPAVTVVRGDARRLRELLAERTARTPVKAVVSSLPLLTLPDRQCRAILAAAFDLLPDNGVFVQFSYGPISPVPRRLCDTLGILAERGSRVLFNLPPATVWRYEAA